MHNFSDELISAYLDGELSQDERDRVEKAMRDDEALHRMCDELRVLRRTLKDMPKRSPATDWSDQVLRRAERMMLSPPAAASSGDVATASKATVTPTARDHGGFRWKLPAAIAGLGIVAASVLLVVTGPWWPGSAEVANVPVSSSQRTADSMSMDEGAVGFQDETEQAVELFPMAPPTTSGDSASRVLNLELDAEPIDRRRFSAAGVASNRDVTVRLVVSRPASQPLNLTGALGNERLTVRSLARSSNADRQQRGRRQAFSEDAPSEALAGSGAQTADPVVIEGTADDLVAALENLQKIPEFSLSLVAAATGESSKVNQQLSAVLKPAATVPPLVQETADEGRVEAADQTDQADRSRGGAKEAAKQAPPRPEAADASSRERRESTSGAAKSASPAPGRADLPVADPAIRTTQSDTSDDEPPSRLRVLLLIEYRDPPQQ